MIPAMPENSAHFYVMLRDSFAQRCVEHEDLSLFKDLENPYLEARQHLTPGRRYPVIKTGDDGRRLAVIDDSGHLWNGFIELFKFADDR